MKFGVALFELFVVTIVARSSVIYTVLTVNQNAENGSSRWRMLKAETNLLQ
jgi:hypothetical protein